MWEIEIKGDRQKDVYINLGQTFRQTKAFTDKNLSCQRECLCECMCVFVTESEKEREG